MLQNINFKRPMKNHLPFSIQNIKNPKRNYSFSENVVKFSNNSLHKLRAIAPEATFFTSVVGLAPILDHSCSDITGTADENDTNILPEPITSLFDNDANNLDKSLLEEFCLSKFNEYKNSYSQCNFNLLAEVSKTQNLSNTWKLHRAGRITASNFHEVVNKKLQNSKTLLFKIMNYVISPNVASVIYGREMEDKARCFYIKLLKKKSQQFQIRNNWYSYPS
ncbi:uncharacterized protein LOC124814596 [Hydra vulgaris]|uniref:uncharacterized protein LOC124814596 n=1 Tax=Hydra vulgaris TaxID=6087 RepID=UPI001F5EC922|nr:uncharacterized protein LOC124814596 [Hydra vulgaris]